MYIVLIILIIILLILNIIQFKTYKNNKLIIEDLEYKNKELLEKKLKNNNKNTISINEISLQTKKEESKEIIKSNQVEKIITNQQTSPIEVPKKIPECSFELDNYINKTSKIIPNKKDNYIEELPKYTSDNLINLTNYEKDEEENAIISYKELMNNKSKEDTKLFIENLKKLRDSLK